MLDFIRAIAPFLIPCLHVISITLAVIALLIEHHIH